MRKAKSDLFRLKIVLTSPFVAVLFEIDLFRFSRFSFVVEFAGVNSHFPWVLFVGLFPQLCLLYSVVNVTI